MTEHLSRAQRRRLERLARQIDPVIKADARFFERRPERRHRIRVAAAAEVKSLELLFGEEPLSRGNRWFAAVRHLSPDAMIRVFHVAEDSFDVDQPEHICLWAFEHVAARSPDYAKIEAGVRQIMGGFSGGAGLPRDPA